MQGISKDGSLCLLRDTLWALAWFSIGLLLGLSLRELHVWFASL